MKLSTSSAKSAHMLEAYPQWKGPLASILRVVEGSAPGRALDPLVIAQRTGLGGREVLALLNLLVREKIGNLLLRVVDERGLELGRFENVRQIPPVLENQFGDETQVSPELVEIVFVPAQPST